MIGDKEGFFSQMELELMNDSSFLKAKQAITQKVEGLLRQTEGSIKTAIYSKNLLLPDYLRKRTGKISKGEKYQDLPYQVLDYPRYFSRDNIFTFRTMFWWGNFLTCTLHLQGEILDRFRTKLRKNLSETSHPDLYFCINDNPWEYHYEADNYLPINKIPGETFEHQINSRHFVKLSQKLALNEIDQLPLFASRAFVYFYKIIS